MSHDPREQAAPQPPASDHARRLPVDTRQHNGWLAVHLRESALMDPAVIDALTHHVDELISQGNRRLILDFAEVQYISSSMIGALVGSRQMIEKAGGKLILVGLNDRLHELLRITRLDKLFTTEPDVQTAVKNAGPGK